MTKEDIHLLIVDDSLDNLKILGNLFKKVGYQIHAVQSGKQAFEKLEKVPVHLILLDVMLPEMDGFEICKRIKASPKIKDIPVIFLTAKAGNKDLIKAFDAGSVDYLTKPFVTDELVARVDLHVRLQVSLARERQQARELQQALEVHQTISDNLLLTSREIDAGNRKLEDLNRTKDQLLQHLGTLRDTHLRRLRGLHETLLKSPENLEDLIRQAAYEVYAIEESLQPITSLFMLEQAARNKRVLLADTNKHQQTIAKMALRGTKIELDIASDEEHGRVLLEEHEYDIFFVDSELVELSKEAVQLHPEIHSVFMTSQKIPDYLPILREHPFITSIITRQEDDRTFTLKNITTTVSKLTSQDFFGLEKYLNWGVDVHKHSILSSRTRHNLVERMMEDFEKLGIRRTLLNKCALVAEELLMNAIYDAPTDHSGRAIYNHLPRTESVDLKIEERGTFHYACDGMLIAIAAEDPFGAFYRETILDYLESCYEDRAGELNKEKGGAGRGLFEIMETADLVVFNVKPRVRTEVIAIFNIDPNISRIGKSTSFHYFSG